MKLRLAANSVRLRILRPELATLEAGGHLAESVRLAPGPSGSISYALFVAEADGGKGVQVYCECGEVRVVISRPVFVQWCRPDEVGIYVGLHVGEDESLRIMIEKDFACLDSSEADNRDTFEHPHTNATC